MSVQRGVRGDFQTLSFPKSSGASFAAGELIIFDTASGSVQLASTAAGADASARRTNAAPRFVGVCLVDSPADDPGPVEVATNGQFVFNLQGAANLFDLVTFHDTGSSLSTTTVVSTTTTGHAIGRIVSLPGGGRCVVQLFSKVNRV